MIVQIGIRKLVVENFDRLRLKQTGKENFRWCRQSFQRTLAQVKMTLAGLQEIEASEEGKGLNKHAFY
jgi:hypothetical protein